MDIKYRPEIDGLRALAIIPVILYHAGFKIFGGGFVGVDVFFVISGYLITSIIIKDVEAGTFSFRAFYERRARRILPALFLVVVCCLPFSAMWMMPATLKEFATSVISVCIFASNFLFFQQSGYFDAGSELKPLLHTWSLAVEEQFYIIFPIAVLLLSRFGRKYLILTIGIIAIASLVGSEYGSHYFPTFNFYMLPTRAWELMAGALCSFAIFKTNLLRDNCLSIAGVAAVAMSVFIYDDAIPFPSLYTLLPVIGTCLIILFAQKGTLTWLILSRKPIVGVGLISYSAYLWHQPLFAFARIRLLIAPSQQVMLILCVASIVLAYLSWRFVEKPFRLKKTQFIPRTKEVFAIIFVSSAALISVSAAAYIADGFPERIPASANQILARGYDIGKYRQKNCLWGPNLKIEYITQECRLGGKQQAVDFLLLGDSYAGAIADGMDAAAEKTGHSGVLFALHSCPPIMAIGGTWDGSRALCKPYQNIIVKLVERAKPKIVILVADWGQLDNKRLILENNPNAKDGYEAFYQFVFQTVKEMKETGTQVYIICCTPHAVDKIHIPQAYAKMKFFGSAPDVRLSREQFEAEYKTAFEIFRHSDIQNYATLIDLTDTFCRSGKCDLMKEDKPLFFDYGHLSLFGSLSLSPVLEKIFNAD